MPALSGVCLSAPGVPVRCLVRAYSVDSGALVGQTLSSPADGTWSITTTNAEHFVVRHDADDYDSNWANCVLALRCDGADGSTTFTDLRGHALTPTNAEIDTDYYAPLTGNSASALFSSGRLRADASADFDMGTGAFTFDFWIRPTAFTVYGTLFSVDFGTFVNGACYIMLTGSGRISVGNWLNNPVVQTAPGSVVTGTWTHIRVRRAGTTFSIHVNGGAAVTGEASSEMNFSGGIGMNIGRNVWDGADGYFNGRMDSIRIYKGIDLGAPTLPTKQFPAPISFRQSHEEALIFDRVTPV